jgi:uncharacterized C2H2 Zn-finger protein
MEKKEQLNSLLLIKTLREVIQHQSKLRDCINDIKVDLFNITADSIIINQDVHKVLKEEIINDITEIIQNKFAKLSEQITKQSGETEKETEKESNSSDLCNDKESDKEWADFDNETEDEPGESFTTAVHKKKMRKKHKTNIMKEKEKMNRTEKFMKCLKCDFIYKDKKEINNHIKEMHEQTNYLCNVCTDKFITEEALREHVKMYHKINSQE